MAAKKPDDDNTLTLEAVLAWFQLHPIQGMKNTLEHLNDLLAKAVEARKAELQAEAAELGISLVPEAPETIKRTREPNKPKGELPEGDARLVVKPLYRSKTNPELVWSGRGQKSKWLVAEMEETGLPQDAFRITE